VAGGLDILVKRARGDGALPLQLAYFENELAALQDVLFLQLPAQFAHGNAIEKSSGAAAQVLHDPTLRSHTDFRMLTAQRGLVYDDFQFRLPPNAQQPIGLPAQAVDRGT